MGAVDLLSKLFGLAIRSSLLHLSRLDLDQAAPVTPVYVPSEQAREEEARVDWDEEQRKNQQAVNLDRVNPDGSDGCFCCLCLGTLQVQCPVHRLHPSFGGSRSGLPPRSHSFISLSGLHSQPWIQCNIITLCASKKEDLGVCLLQQEKKRDVNVTVKGF